jgi:hypothetical protein
MHIPENVCLNVEYILMHPSAVVLDAFSSVQSAVMLDAFSLVQSAVMRDAFSSVQSAVM